MWLGKWPGGGRAGGYTTKTVGVSISKIQPKSLYFCWRETLEISTRAEQLPQREATQKVSILEIQEKIQFFDDARVGGGWVMLGVLY